MDPRDVEALDGRTPVICSIARTPLGAFQGALSSLSATDLGGIAIRAAVERANLSPDAVDEVLMGNVLPANLGQAPTTQAALKAGLPTKVPCTGINKVCSSGLKAVMLAAHTIQTGNADVIVAGGMESMSNAPHYLPGARGSGLRLGHGSVVDGVITDGLWDPHKNVHMGTCAEMCAERHGITREQQDEHALASHERTRVASASGRFSREIVPVVVGGVTVTADEGTAKMDPTKLRRLRPYFKKDGGTVTAGNASPLTDGAAAVVVASAAASRRLGLPVLAVVRASADANQEPEWFTTAPALAIPKVLSRCGLSVKDVDYWEVNEAFSVVDLANRKILGLAPDRVNVHGGSVALGHPIGASGARILVTLINVLLSRNARYGCAAICNGGGGASAMVVEAVQGGGVNNGQASPRL